MKLSSPTDKNGFFITFEGIEGSGKSKHIGQLFTELEKEGFPVILTREPGGTRIGEKIRDLILEPEHREIEPATELLLYLAARAQHIHELILPALGENKIVLCDRFHDSTYAYQGGGRGIDSSLIDPIIQAPFLQIKPDLTFLLDLPPAEALERVQKRTAVLNRIDAENIAFHETVRSNYLILVQKEPGRFKVIDSSRDYSEVHREISSSVHLQIKNFRHDI